MNVSDVYYQYYYDSIVHMTPVKYAIKYDRFDSVSIGTLEVIISL